MKQIYSAPLLLLITFLNTFGSNETYDLEAMRKAIISNCYLTTSSLSIRTNKSALEIQVDNAAHVEGSFSERNLKLEPYSNTQIKLVAESLVLCTDGLINPVTGKDTLILDVKQNEPFIQGFRMMRERSDLV